MWYFLGHSSWISVFVTGGEDRIGLDTELQKEISIIWPYLPQKTLDLLVPINKGLSLAGLDMETLWDKCKHLLRYSMWFGFHRYRHDSWQNLRLHDDHGLLQTEQSQEAPSATWSTGWLFILFLSGTKTARRYIVNSIINFVLSTFFWPACSWFLSHQKSSLMFKRLDASTLPEDILSETQTLPIMAHSAGSALWVSALLRICFAAFALFVTPVYLLVLPALI